MTLTIEKIISGGAGLGFGPQGAVFVPGALPGETWEVEIVLQKKSFSQARGLRLLSEPHPQRVEPRCPLVSQCGGCDFQHLSSPYQREVKAALVREAFQRLGKMECPPVQVFAGESWGYRGRFQIHRQGNLRGFMAAGTHTIVPVSACPVGTPGVNHYLQHPDSGSWDGRKILGGDEKTFALETPGGRLVWEILGKRLEFSLEGFFQSNQAMTQVLVQELKNRWGRGAKALDLYAGAGLFGAFLQEDFQEVLCVEENPKALELARINAPKAQRFAQSLETWALDPRAQAADVAVADPPRTGLSSGVQKYLVQAAIPKLFYVSCNPDTLARDARVLVDGGYQLKEVLFLDFYPQTSHLEALGVFEKV